MSIDSESGLGKRINLAIDERTSQTSTDLLPLDYTPRRFKNIIDFCAHPEGLALGTSIYHYCRQYQNMRDLYGLICPLCNTKRHPKVICECCDPKDLDIAAIPTNSFDCWGLTPAQLQQEALFELQNGVMTCPKCGFLQADAGWPQYNTLIGVAGMRSTKSATAAEIMLWELHNDLLLDNPQRTWGLLPGQEVRYTVAATTDTQSKSTTFSQVDGLLDNGPWFVNYIAALKRAAKKHGKPVDEVFVKGVTEIKFLHKQLFVDIVGSNSAGAAGRTRRMVVIDEVARFVDSEADSRMGVDKVYSTLNASLLTLAKYGAKMICISSPMYKGDKIMDLHNSAMKEIAIDGPTNTLLFHFPTWRMNPELPEDHPFIKAEYKKNPFDAKRDFGAIPPGATNPWILEEAVNECIDKQIPCLVKNVVDAVRITMVGGRLSNLLGKQLDLMVLDVPTTPNIVIAADPGHRHDSFGMILMYSKNIRTVDGLEEHLYVGAVLEWRPEERTETEVDFRNALDAIYKFAKHWNVNKVVFDQWQSIQGTQELAGAGIDAEQIGLSNEDWKALASLIYGHRVHLLSADRGGPAAAKLVTELKHLESTRGRVDHSPRSSSDLAVCLARAVKILAKPELQMATTLGKQAESLGRVIHFRR